MGVHYFNFKPNRGNRVMFKRELLPDYALHIYDTRPFIYHIYTGQHGEEYALAGDEAQVHPPLQPNRCSVPLAACMIFE